MQCKRIAHAIRPKSNAKPLKAENSGRVLIEELPRIRNGTRIVTPPGMRNVKKMALTMSCGLIMNALSNSQSHPRQQNSTRQMEHR